MSGRIVVIFGLATMAAAVALAEIPSSLSHKELQAIGQGRGVYLVNCAGCHGSDARGAPTGSHAATAPDLTQIAVRDGRFDRLHVQNHIENREACTPNGNRRLATASGMPCWGQHFEAQAAKGDGYAPTRLYTLVRYLDFVQTTDAAPTSK